MRLVFPTQVGVILAVWIRWRCSHRFSPHMWGWSW